MKRVVQRTPDLGLAIRLQRLAEVPVAESPAPAPGCEPGPTQAGWWNSTTAAYDLAAVSRDLKTVEMSALPEIYSAFQTVPVGDFRAEAMVNGALCDCAVTWDVSFAEAEGSATYAPPRVSPLGRYLVVDAQLASGDLRPLPVSPGVLTLTPSVDCAGVVTALSPITLTLTNAGTIAPCPAGCGEYTLGLFTLSGSTWNFYQFLAPGTAGVTLTQSATTRDYAVAVVREVDGDLAPYDYDVQVSGLTVNVTNAGGGVLTLLAVTPAYVFSDPAALKITSLGVDLLCLAKFRAQKGGSCNSVFGNFGYSVSVMCADGSYGNAWSAGGELRVGCLA